MRRFLHRILICTIPVIAAIAVVVWAYNEYQNGRGGFRLGVDLAGGTILVYEVDESKMPQDFKADELAAALKRRIDPNDLYNITIRPVPGTPPRVEIILPTGGQHQARAEQRNWDRLIEALEKQYPPKEASVYRSVHRGPNAYVELGDLVKKDHPEVDRQEITTFIEQHSGQSKDKRFLSSDEVENIKTLIEKQGRLEFRILANETDDPSAIKAASDWLKDPKNVPELERLEVRAEPPPPPRNDGGAGSPEFQTTLAGQPSFTYNWVELGKSELHSLHLNSEALTRPEYAQLAQIAENARKNHTGFNMPGMTTLFYTRKITDWSRRRIKDRDQHKTVEYFVLTRDQPAGQEITGDYLTRAAENQNPREAGRRSIAFSFNSEGANLFRELTTLNKPDSKAGFKRHLAIVFDAQVVSAPTLNAVIGADGEISGDFSQQDVQDMVRLLRAGALPATLKKDPVSQNSMGATLGQDTIDRGTWAVFWAFLAVMVFMAFYYRFAGLVACVALLANLVLTVAFMVVVKAAFTLPGLAGLVLMLGMAVDANVLIYERLREERDRGATLALALRNGYDRALPTIIDTHLSSIFTAIVLYAVGNDQLKGFGISLTVGLIISLFTSLYMTRTLFEVWLTEGWLKDLRFTHIRIPLGGGRSFDLHNPKIDFMAIRYYWFTATIVLTIIGAALFAYRLEHGALNIDFVGGTAYTAQLAKPLTLTQLHAKLSDETKLAGLAIDQVYLSSDTDLPQGTSRLFTVRTSNKDMDEVMEYVNTQLRDDLKLVKLKEFQINPAGTEADLKFSEVDPDGQEKEGFASPAQIQMLLRREFAERGQSTSGFEIAKAGQDDEHYNELKVKLNEALPAGEFKILLEEMQKKLATTPQPERLENFDAQLATSTRERALYAILLSWAAILFYLWFRFGSWTFGTAAVLCLIHDLFFTLGCIVGCHYLHGTSFGWLLGIQDFKFDLPSVAALLTLVGYSVNDTIVVFDRIREVRGKNPALTPKMINDSVNQTLSRTLLASMTVWLVVIVLYFFGGEGVKLFAFVMVVGVIVGTYSSIYIASPLLLIFGEGHTPAERGRVPQPAVTPG